MANYLYDKYLPTEFPQFHGRLKTYINQLTSERNLYNLFLTQLTTFVNYEEEFNKIFFQPDNTTVEYQGRKYMVVQTPMVRTKSKEETLHYIIREYQTQNFQHRLKDVLIAETPQASESFVKELSHVYERTLKYCYSEVETQHFRGSLYLINSIHYKMESEDKHV